ncbi:iron ABC transporter permease [Streptacidiphilus sp. P02-A3a]|uniref:ABC transporter permease n=1 Tax=Streptacidiphilus sp. P02-A3a TaxID=2704468 RepID=UPI0015FA8B09|nr:iron ABC transporter permease [Streptacidiphilus sp. P02-A3a]QMU71084.1 iron ABC transporter permease [Streptacidiphilus sp. P02-A3a]
MTDTTTDTRPRARAAGAAPRPRGRAAARLRGTARALPWVVFAGVLLLPVGGFLLVAFSPQLFGQGGSWFTLSAFSQVMSGWTARALLDTCLVGAAAAVIATAVAAALAWITERTDLAGRGVWRLLLWALLLAPSYLESLGWTWLVEPQGVLSRLLGQDPATLRDLVFGPVGVVWVLASRGVPFAYLAVSALVRGMGREFEDAARTHGASRLATARLLLPILAPGLWAGFAIVFAESISDYGVAATLAAQANFPLVTGAMEQSVSTFPAQFQLASAMGWLLLGLVGLALLAQRRSMRGRSFTVLSGRTRPAVRSRLSPRAQLGALAGVGAFFALALGVPTFGAAAAALLPSGGKVALSTLTLANFRQVLHSGEMLSALGYSARMSAITACAALVLGAFAGRALARRGAGAAGRLLDLLLLAAIALPSVLLASGYIFTYNLPIASDLGINLYGTSTLLVLGYLAGALPSAARLLSGSLGQVSDSLLWAARVHGRPAAPAWSGAVLPLVAGSLVWTWLIAFCGTLLELPVSQLLAPPGEEPLSVAITRQLQGYNVGAGAAMTVLVVVAALVLIAVALGALRLLLPAAHRLEAVV